MSLSSPAAIHDPMSISDLAVLLVETQKERKRMEACERSRAWTRANRERANAGARSRRNDPDVAARELAYRRANKQRTADRQKQRYQNDADYRRGMVARAKSRAQRQSDAISRGDPRAYCDYVGRQYGGKQTDLFAVMQAQQFRCAVTRLPLDVRVRNLHPLQPSVDHIVPRAHGGTDDPSNLRWVIWAVNSARRDPEHDAVLAELIRPSENLRARLEAEAPDYVREAV